MWVQTSSPLFPNLFTFIIGHPGTGKTRSIREGRRYYSELPEAFLAPTSLTFSSLVDYLARSKRFLPRMPDEPLEYACAYLAPDEIGAFIHKWENEMIDGLSAFYDADDYAQERRGNDLKVKVKSPCVNILAGATPQRLLELMPESAWGQGFTSRTIMIFSDERILGDDFEPPKINHSDDLEHDLAIISGLCGKFDVTADYRTAVNNWRALGEPPIPDHPKLIHYVTRRRVHLYKLSMISAIDRSNALILTKDDFNRALGWMVEAEDAMPEIFKAGAKNADGQALDEIYHFIMINDRGQGVPEQKIVRFASDLIPIHSILRVIEIMERSGKIRCVKIEPRTGLKNYSTNRPSADDAPLE